MPSAASLETQRKRRPDELQCGVKGCENLVYMIIETRSGKKHLACYGHMNELAQKYMRADDCLAIFP